MPNTFFNHLWVGIFSDMGAWLAKNF